MYVHQPTLAELVRLKQGIKTTTRVSYARLLRPIDHLTIEDPAIFDYVSSIPNPNTKRATAIALRSMGVDIPIPRGFPRVYQLPDEETLRLVLSYSKYEVQFLTMAYLGLRIGEAAWVSKQDLIPGNRIYVSKQVAEWQEGGKWLFEVREPKSIPAVIDCPPWLADMLPEQSDPLDPIRPYRLRAAMHYTTNKYLGYGLPCHALRHFYATAMLKADIPLPIVQRQMRHSDIATTLRTYAQFGGVRMDLFDAHRT